MENATKTTLANVAGQAVHALNYTASQCEGDDGYELRRHYRVLEDGGAEISVCRPRLCDVYNVSDAALTSCHP